MAADIKIGAQMSLNLLYDRVSKHSYLILTCYIFFVEQDNGL